MCQIDPFSKIARSVVPPPTSMRATPRSCSSRVSTDSGRGHLLEHRVAHLDPGAIDAGHEVLDRGRRGGDDVDVRLQPGPGHPDGLGDPALVVEDEFLGQDVQDLAVLRDRDRARGVHHPSQVLARHRPFLPGDRDDPRLLNDRMWPPAMPTVARSTATPAISSASSTQDFTASTVASKLMTTPLRSPRDGADAEADDVHGAAVSHLRDDAANLGGSDVEADDVAFVFRHGSSRSPLRIGPRRDRREMRWLQRRSTRTASPTFRAIVGLQRQIGAEVAIDAFGIEENLRAAFEAGDDDAVGPRKIDLRDPARPRRKRAVQLHEQGDAACEDGFTVLSLVGVEADEQRKVVRELRTGRPHHEAAVIHDVDQTPHERQRARGSLDDRNAQRLGKDALHASLP